MSRSRIIAGKAVIIIEAKDLIDKTLGSIRSKMHNFANTMGAIGDQVFRTGFFGAIASGSIIKQFITLEDLFLTLRVKLGYLGKMSQLQTATLSHLSTVIRQLGISTSFTSQEIAQASVVLAQGNFSPKEIEDSLQSILDLGRGTRTELQPAAEAYVRTVRAFGLSTADAESTVSQFVRATRLGVLELEDLNSSMKYASGTAGALKQKLAPILAILVEASNKGISGSTAGTSLNTAMSQIAKKMEDLKEVFPGFVPQKTKDGAFDFLTTLKELFKVSSKLGDLERVAFFQDIFNLRGARVIYTIQDVKKILDLADNIASAGDEARQAAIIQDSKLGGSLRRAIGAVADFAYSLGEAGEKYLLPFLEGIKELINQLNALAALNPAISALVVLSPALLLGAGLGFIALAKGARIAAYAVGALMSVWKPLSNLLARGTGQQLGLLLGSGRRRTARVARVARPPSLRAYINRNVWESGARGPQLLRMQARGMASLANKQTTQRIAQRAAAISAYQGKLSRLAATEARYTSTIINKSASSAKVLQARQRLVGIPAARDAAKQQLAARLAARTGGLANANQLRQQSAASTARLAKRTAALKTGRAATRVRLIGAEFSGAARGLTTFTKGFFTGLNAVRRFAFSLGSVLTILEGIFLFTDIPNQLARGFTNAAKALAKIGTFGGGSFDLFRVGFEALSQGKAELGLESIKASIQSLASIIYNQLIIAWNRFKEALGSTWDIIRNIGGSLLDIVNNLVLSIKEVFGSAIGTIGNFADMVIPGAEEGGGFIAAAGGVVEALTMLIPKLFNWISKLIIELHSWSKIFMAHFEHLITTTFTGIPQKAADNLRDAKIAEAGSEAGLRQKRLDIGLKETLDSMQARFKRNAAAEGAAGAAKAEADSVEEMLNASYLAEMLRQELNKKVPEAAKVAPPPGVIAKAAELAEVKKASMVFASVLVGSAQSIQRNQLKFGKSTDEQQLAEQKKTNLLLQKGLENEGVINFAQ